MYEQTVGIQRMGDSEHVRELGKIPQRRQLALRFGV